MIYDKIANIAKYRLNSVVETVVNSLKTENYEVGRYDFEEGVYMLIQEYATQGVDVCKMEAHHRYIDIQVVIEGNETFGYAYDGVEKAPYNEEKDVVFFDSKERYIDLESGEFLLLLPSDYHKPKIGNGTNVKKAVIKVPVELFA